MRYFSNFPNLYYSNNFVLNVFAKIQFTEKFAKYKKNFLPYTVKEKERADTIAYDYYEDQYNDWVVYFSNKTIDPYYDFLLTDDTFSSYIEKKYGSIAAAQQKIVGYRNNWSQDEQVLSPSTYNALPAELKKYWVPVISLYGAVTGYERANLDTKITTNKIISITLASNNTSAFTVDETVAQSNTTANVATGVVTFSNTSTLMLKHITGEFEANTSLSLKGNTSNVNTSATSVTLIKQNLSNNEVVYFSSYTAYDEEVEKNEAKRNIDLVSNRYVTILEREMRNLLSEQ